MKLYNNLKSHDEDLEELDTLRLRLSIFYLSLRFRELFDFELLLFFLFFLLLLLLLSLL